VIGEEASLDDASRPELAVIKRFALATVAAHRGDRDFVVAERRLWVNHVRFRESPAGPQCPRSRRSHEQGGIDEKDRIRTLLEQPTEQAIPYVQASSEGLADFPHCLLKDRSIQRYRAQWLPTLHFRSKLKGPAPRPRTKRAPPASPMSFQKWMNWAQRAVASVVIDQ
jgi:hypothetical protein